MKFDICSVGSALVDFTFSKRILNTVLENFFSEAVKKMVRAFEERANTLYS